MTVGIILSGCGVFDGSEIHEAVATLIALDRRGVPYQCLAPNRPFEVIDHMTSKPTGEQRNTLTEAARIARGEVLDLADVRGSDFDALILPGGFGAAKNLCSFAADGPDCTVDPDVERVLTEAHAASRPIGFICIAPAVGARVFGAALHPSLTIGRDTSTAEALEAMGATHTPADPDDIITDEANLFVSTPAYMSATRIGQVATGIDKLVGRVMELVATASTQAS